MKFLHSADLHLGSPLRAAGARDAGAVLDRAVGGVVERIADLALREKVQAVILAGDIFDSDAPDVTLRARFLAQLRRLTGAGIAVIAIRGNHDELLDLGRFGPPGDGIFLLDRETPTALVGDVAFHGLGFEGRAPRSTLPDYPAAHPGRLNVGLMHTSLDGAPGHDPYAPCRTGDLLAHGYDYWALGHIHKRSERVDQGVAVVMPGIPQGRHINEDAGGTVTLATLGGNPDLRQVPVETVRWERRELDAQDLDEGDLLNAFAALPEGPPFRMVRWVARGAVLPEGELLDLAREAIEGRDDVAVEAVRRAAPPPPEAGILTDLMMQEVQRASYLDEAKAFLSEWRDALPSEIRDELAEEHLDDLIAEGLAAATQAVRGA
ncbi:metallophosphoesterase family protein [Jannaschia aquimarina]|uniref:YhaO protein n=1 Tax=Jannaschia aquimarina TaxID=935700 RepID=A0A0D1EDE3_9RHOB|nr:DNA repair exonuclease [Jannaschia aquimarina]KIT14951.1 putative metallophosphoesterase YhaO [Jannaschia aquimarina]SNS60246.1 DNA repair exonuclease SbcCD nuclease subunit [Jannaschia aquimarina]